MNMGKSVIDFNEKKGFICDMDGVIYHGNQILPGVPVNLECIGDMQQYLYKKSVWGEDAVYTGFPGAEGKGRIFIFDK